MEENNGKEVCYECGKEFVRTGVGTGYGYDKDMHKICYSCCAKRDLKDIENLKYGEKTALYLNICKKPNGEEARLVNWPGTLIIPIYYLREGRHNIAGVQRTCYFYHKGKEYIARQYGNDSEIARIKLTKCKNILGESEIILK